MSVINPILVSSGGDVLPPWQDPDWVDIGALYDADTESYTYKRYSLISASDLVTILPAGYDYITSDGSTYIDGGTHTWNTASDFYDSFNTPFRWIAMYTNSTLTGTPGTIPNYNLSLLWDVFGIPITNILQGATIANTTYDFSNNNGLTHIDFKATLPKLQSAFINCRGLYNISVINNVDVDANAFISCVSLHDCIFATRIGISGFNGTSALKYVKITDLTGTLGSAHLTGSLSLENIEVLPGFNMDGLNISASTKFSTEVLVRLIDNLADRSATTTYTVIMGATNLVKLTAAQLLVGQNKNWSFS